MTPEEVLIAARALIDSPEKWCQLVPNDMGGRRCVLRAVDDAAMPASRGTLDVSIELIHLALPKSFHPQYLEPYQARERIAYYNDMRTHRSVLKLIDRAIEAA